jgi:hypothetical protein
MYIIGHRVIGRRADSVDSAITVARGIASSLQCTVNVWFAWFTEPRIGAYVVCTVSADGSVTW